MPIATSTALLVGGLATAGGSVAAGAIGSRAAGRAANAQAQSAAEALAEQRRQFDLTREDTEPWRRAGAEGIGWLRDMLAPDGQLRGEFTGADLENEPGYQFRLREGQRALEHSAAAHGTLQSGGTLRSLARYGQDFASTEFQNAFNRFESHNTNLYNRLAGLSGAGQTAVSQAADAGQNYANQASDLITGAGNARASGYIGGANAWRGALGGVNNSFQDLLAYYAGRGGGAGLPGSQTPPMSNMYAYGEN